MKNKSILFILIGKFPTNNAFGITTLGTAMAAVGAGYKVNILSSNSYLYSEDFFTTNRTRDFLSRFLANRISDSYFGRIFFRFVQVYISLKACIINLKLSDNIFWVRDPIVALLLLVFTKKQTPIICEIHRINNIFETLIYRILHRRKRVVLCPITQIVKDRLPKHLYNKVVLGMAVDDHFLNSGRNRVLNFKNDLVVAYLGRSSSSEEKLNVNFLRKLLEHCELNNKSWKFIFIGFTDKKLLKFSQVNMFDNIKHSEIPEFLLSANVGLVMYPDTNYFKSSFPIKVMEYAATKLLIVASSTQAHLEILGSDKALYFPENNYLKLYYILEQIEINRNLNMHKIEAAFKWAEKNSYSQRLNTVLTELDSRLLN